MRTKKCAEKKRFIWMMTIATIYTILADYIVMKNIMHELSKLPDIDNNIWNWLSERGQLITSS